MTNFNPPNLITFEEHGNDWQTYIDAVYTIFKADFILSQPKRGLHFIFVRPTIEDQNKERAFWHITSTGKIESERTPDLRRCERIRFPKPMVELDKAPNLKIWEKEVQMSGKRIEKRLHISTEDFSYLVVLSPLEKGYKRYLITTFYLEQNHQRVKNKKSYDDFHSLNA